MGFIKGDPNINRKGRPKNAQSELLREALRKEGERRGENFWDRVSKTAFEDKGVMIAVLKKFIPDMSSTEHSGELHVTEMPTVIIDGQPLELDIGSRITKVDLEI